MRHVEIGSIICLLDELDVVLECSLQDKAVRYLWSSDFLVFGFRLKRLNGRTSASTTNYARRHFLRARR